MPVEMTAAFRQQWRALSGTERELLLELMADWVDRPPLAANSPHPGPAAARLRLIGRLDTGQSVVLIVRGGAPPAVCLVAQGQRRRASPWRPCGSRGTKTSWLADDPPPRRPRGQAGSRSGHSPAT
jgi:hypothetical protein